MHCNEWKELMNERVVLIDFLFILALAMRRRGCRGVLDGADHRGIIIMVFN